MRGGLAGTLTALGIGLACGVAWSDSRETPDQPPPRSLLSRPERPAKDSLSEQERAQRKLAVLGAQVSPNWFVLAAGNGNREILSLFLKAGADVNAPNDGGCTALCAAIAAKDPAMAKLLLSAGADVNGTNPNGVSPLIVASMCGDRDLARLLIEAGAELDAVDDAGHSALHHSVLSGNTSLFELLIAHGATPSSAPCCDDGPILAHAAKSRSRGIFMWLLERAPPGQAWDATTRGILLESLQKRDVSSVSLLLGKYPDPPTPEGKSQPLLAYAIAGGDLPLLNLLLACGADPNTPLNSPVEKSFAAMFAPGYLRHYLETEPNMTCLMLAAGLGQTEAVAALLSRGAARGRLTKKYKLAALTFAAKARDVRSMQLLIGNCPGPEKLRIEIDLGFQRAMLVKDGIPVLSTPISSGRPGFATPEGDYVITDKDRSRFSTIYRVAMPFFMRLSCGDFGMHAGEVPPYPASHGCIRIPPETARWLFREVPLGTFVRIR